MCYRSFLFILRAVSPGPLTTESETTGYVSQLKKYYRLSRNFNLETFC